MGLIIKDKGTIPHQDVLYAMGPSLTKNVLMHKTFLTCLRESRKRILLKSRVELSELSNQVKMTEKTFDIDRTGITIIQSKVRKEKSSGEEITPSKSFGSWLIKLEGFLQDQENFSDLDDAENKLGNLREVSMSRIIY